MVVASPAISSTVSPFVRSAISTAAVWTSVALPSMISARTSAASSPVRSAPEASRSMACVRTSGIGEEVAQQRLPVGREHGLGVELDPEGGQLLVAHGHEHAAAA